MIQTILRIAAQNLLGRSRKLFDKQLTSTFVLVPGSQTSYHARGRSNALARHDEVSSTLSVGNRSSQSECIIYAPQRREKNNMRNRQTLAFGVRLIF